jgi:pyruvate kinase
MGVELSTERVPLIQKRLIRLANQVGVPVITATQMLESMIESPVPTRAEASDVANAILDGTDAVMLSAETAIGQYPVEAVQTMARIADEVEGTDEPYQKVERRRESHPQILAHAADVLAEELGARALVVYTQSGYTAQLLSKERPSLPIFAFTSKPRVANRLALWFGAIPLLGPDIRNTDRLLDFMQGELLKRGLVSPGQNVVFVRLAPPMAHRRSNFITVRTVPPER